MTSTTWLAASATEELVITHDSAVTALGTLTTAKRSARSR